MKFTWFNLMPWPHLPDDFREKHHSVWVDIPNELYDPLLGNRVYNDYLDQLEYADELGFDGIGVNEHHAVRRPDIFVAGTPHGHRTIPYLCKMAVPWLARYRGTALIQTHSTGWAHTCRPLHI